MTGTKGWEKTLRGFDGKPVLVLGDIMLDEYIWGEVRRISPEAPVPVVAATHRTYRPGGAANVAANVVSLGGQALLCGVVGCDGQAQVLRSVLSERAVDTTGLVVDPQRPTTTKTRVMAQNQQVVRVDAESSSALDEDLEQALLQQALRRLNDVAGCILSAYGKGVLSRRLVPRVIAAIRRSGKPVIVDPKGTDYAKYRGATVVTPNTHEAGRAVKQEINTEADLAEVSQHLLDLLDGSVLLITRGAHGMSLYVKGTDAVHIPALARTVFDVTGAGDTVVSTLTMALVAGASLEDAARLANRAAGVVVGKVGASTVTRDELYTVLQDGKVA